MNQDSLSELERFPPPPLVRDTLRTDVFSELLKIQKFGHLFIGILCMFFYSIFCTILTISST